MKFIFPQAKHMEPHLPVVPAFMPFAGCRVRCVFCAQTAQTGRGERQLNIVLGELEQTLQEYADAGTGPVEVAFYGGTFTALPVQAQMDCLAVTNRWRREGLVGRVRCSTRPDCIDRENVVFLQDNGVSLIELGVQSFSDRALQVSGRNYTAECIVDACRTIKELGLHLGIQLMPGLPGASLEDSYDDVRQALALIPSCVRLYPCLVFAETSLATMWRKGDYVPLTLHQTVDLLSYACLNFWREGIPVIRMGVAPEPSAMKSLLAGPWHHSLGNMVRGAALLEYITQQVDVFRKRHPAEPLFLSVPRSFQGDLWGFKGEFKGRYAALGVEKVLFDDGAEFTLSCLSVE